jgi:hypothetical protein
LVALPGAVFCAARLAGFDTFYPALQLIAYTPYAVGSRSFP